MSTNFINCDMNSLIDIDNTLIRSFEATGAMSDITVYIDGADAQAILDGMRTAEVSPIGTCHYDKQMFKDEFGFIAFVCQKNVNLRHLSGLAVNAFVKKDPRDVYVIPNLRLGSQEDPEWVPGGTTAVVIGFAIRNMPCRYSQVSCGRLLAVAQDAGGRLVFCVIETGTDFEDAKFIRTSRMHQLIDEEPTSSVAQIQQVVPNITSAMTCRLKLFLADADKFVASQK